MYFTVKKLTDEQAGILFKHILGYVNDENPVTNDVIIDLVFEPIKQSLKRDLRRYEEIIEKRSLAGKIGGVESGESRRKKKEANEARALKRKQTKQRQANEAVSDIVSVNVSVSDSVKEDNKVSAKKAERDFIDKIIQIFVEVHGDYLIVNNGIERAAAGKLLNIYKKKYPGSTSEETLAALKEYFLSCINIPDDWLRINMSLPTIISKFNQISKVLKNGTKKAGTTNEQIIRSIEKSFGTEFLKAGN